MVVEEEAAQKPRRKILRIDGDYVDVTEFHLRHPGGSEVLLYFERQDATEPFLAFHDYSGRAGRVMRALPRVKAADLPAEYRVELAAAEREKAEAGNVVGDECKKTEEIRVEWLKLRESFAERGLFEPSPWIEGMWVAAIIFTGWLILRLTLSFWGLVDAMLGSVISCLAAALALPFKAVSPILLGLVGGQFGFLMHIFGHRSVFRKDSAASQPFLPTGFAGLNLDLDYIAQAVIEGVFNGDSARSWNLKHTKHHAKTNVAHRDVDIQPLFFWKKELVGAFFSFSEKHQWALRYQHIFVYALYALLTVYRRIESWGFVFGVLENGTALGRGKREGGAGAKKFEMAQKEKPAEEPFERRADASPSKSSEASVSTASSGESSAALLKSASGPTMPRLQPDADQIAYQNRPRDFLLFEGTLILLHYVLAYYCYARFLDTPGVLVGVAFYLAFSVSEALYLSLIFTANHNHLDIQMDPNVEKSWLEMNANGTVNYEDSWLCSVATGYLNFQIEHHLCPTMPCYNLPRIAPEVRALCKRVGLEYKKERWVDAMRANHVGLREVAEAFVIGEC